LAGGMGMLLLLVGIVLVFGWVLVCCVGRLWCVCVGGVCVCECGMCVCVCVVCVWCVCVCVWCECVCVCVLI